MKLSKRSADTFTMELTALELETVVRQLMGAKSKRIYPILSAIFRNDDYWRALNDTYGMKKIQKDPMAEPIDKWVEEQFRAGRPVEDITDDLILVPKKPVQ